jgi:acetyl esterase/lipase
MRLLILVFIFIGISNHFANCQDKNYTITNDLIYCSQNNYQKLDLYTPESSNKKFPLVIWLHGGGFKNGDKKNELIETKAKAFTDKQIAFASINYSLLPFKWPAQITDIILAINYLKNNQDTFKIDMQRIGIIGISAGANLGTLLGTISDTTVFLPDTLIDLWQNVKIKAVVDISGVTDYEHLAKDSKNEGIKLEKQIESKSREIFNSGSGQNLIQEIRNASSLTYISRNDPSFLFIRGQDDLVPLKQINRFYEKAIVKNIDIKVINSSVIGHGSILFSTNEDEIMFFFSSLLLSGTH